MKKYSWLIGLLVVAALGWLAFDSFKQSKQTSTVQNADVLFSVRDTANIDKIFIAGKDGTKNLLERKSKTVWTMNGNQTASPILVNALLEVVRDVQMKRPCLTKEKQEVLKQIATKHLKVEVYVKGAMVRSYYIGGVTTDHLGQYMMLTDAEDPYVCHIPGFEGFLDIRYKIDSLSWRTPQAFLGSDKSIKSLKITENGKTTLQLSKGATGWVLSDGKAANALKTQNYVQKYNRLFIGEWKSNGGLRRTDSLLKLKPLVELDIEDQNNNLSRQLKFYPAPTSAYHFTVLSLPSGHTAEVSKELFGPFFIMEEELR